MSAGCDIKMIFLLWTVASIAHVTYQHTNNNV